MSPWICKFVDLPATVNTYTVKSAHKVTSIKQSPVLKGHLFLVMSYELNLF
jgi:hypothetical protein